MVFYHHYKANGTMQINVTFGAFFITRGRKVTVEKASALLLGSSYFSVSN